MTGKYGVRSFIYQGVYPLVDSTIQKDIDSYWDERNDNKFGCLCDQFSAKWYWRHMTFNGMMGLSDNNSQFTIYSGGIGMGCGYEIIYDTNTLIYTLVAVNENLNKFDVYVTSEWISMVAKLDMLFEEHRDILSFMV